MKRPLRALLVEDVEQDAALVLRELRRVFDVTYERVDTPEAMSAALEKATWDVILSDYSMPRFTAPLALKVLREKALDLPFIIVSGTVNEDVAVEALRAGAHDFMAKGKLGRLLPAIDRELREAASRAEQKKLQDQLVISDRMASMGTLAAGVAHEINNPLACVLANLELAALNVERVEEQGLAMELGDLREELLDARAAVERIRNIVRDLKIFSKSQDDELGPVDVPRVMESTLRMAWNEIRHRARLVKNYAKTPPVLASESRLGQVFLNLVVNAAQAIGEGRADDNEIRISTSSASNGQIVVEIADTGPGMSPEVREKLFTPFFTTKPLGLGTGLGLSICHRIVTGFGGSIEVDSELGKGTTFRVLLPATAAVAQVEAPQVALDQTARRRGRILVVDDEPMIARVISRTLSSEHEIIATDRAVDALERISSGERYDVILCDVMMPQMTGIELHAELCKVEPAQARRVIFLTGGTFTPAARAFLDEVANKTVEKPFDTQLLRALVNEQIK